MEARAHSEALEAFHAFSRLFADPVVLLTIAGEIVCANEAGARAGLTPAKRLDDWASGPGDARAYLSACVRVGQPLQGRLQVRGDAGDAVVWGAHGARWQCAAQAAPLVILRLSPLKSAVAQFAALTERIEALNKEIARRRAVEEGLRESEAALREADRRKDVFLATLAHELRNPLAPIRTAVDLLNLEAASPSTRQTARDMIRRQVDHMVRLVEDLVDASRIKTGKLILRRQRVLVQDVVAQAVETVRPLLHGHHFTLSLPREPIYLDADPVRVAQVIANLLDNAAKYTEKAGHISLTAQAQEACAVLKVRDSGMGIPAERLSQVFDMFLQLHPISEHSRQGLGIGLSLARALVEMHGGTIAAHSAGAGKGSEFIVQLPMLRESFASQDDKKQAEHWEKGLIARRILVVDDNRDAAESLATLLRLEGNDVHTAYDGLEAVKIGEGFKPDVILLDLGMPRMNGYDACRAMRGTAWGVKAVIVALSGWGHEDDRSKSQQAGFDAHLTKPVNGAALTKLVASLLLERIGY